MSLKNEVARNLLQIKAIKLNPQNPFTWASGMRSPIYCDNRLSLSYPDVRNLVIRGFVEVSKKFESIQAICGVATAGIPHGALLADRLNLPFAYVRSSAKSHGRQNQIEGELSPGSKVIVIEDLISTGGSSLEAVQVLRQSGMEVLGVLAIFDYGFDKAFDNFKNAQCPYQSLSNYDALLEEALAIQYISSEEKDILASWRKDPEQWFNKIDIK
ncbi:MAG: orotate phosphoribosyltransferase [Saprospiraceae bacterium]